MYTSYYNRLPSRSLGFGSIGLGDYIGLCSGSGKENGSDDSGCCGFRV